MGCQNPIFFNMSQLISGVLDIYFKFLMRGLDVTKYRIQLDFAQLIGAENSKIVFKYGI